jgi:hypothetical protein
MYDTENIWGYGNCKRYSTQANYASGEIFLRGKSDERDRRGWSLTLFPLHIPMLSLMLAMFHVQTPICRYSCCKHIKIGGQFCDLLNNVLLEPLPFSPVKALASSHRVKTVKKHLSIREYTSEVNMLLCFKGSPAVPYHRLIRQQRCSFFFFRIVWGLRHSTRFYIEVSARTTVL